MDVCKLTLDDLETSLSRTMSQFEDDYKPTLVSLHMDMSAHAHVECPYDGRLQSAYSRL